MRKIMSWHANRTVLILSVLLLTGCFGSSGSGSSSTTSSPGPNLDSLTIDPATLVIPAGLDRQLTARAITADGEQKDVTDRVTWSSSNADIVSMDATGKLTAKATGQAQIMAVIGNVTARLPVDVTPGVLDSITITTTRDPRKLAREESTLLTATGRYEAGTDMAMDVDISSHVTWVSDFPDKASVDEHGRIQGISQGLVSFTASLGAIESNSIEFEILNVGLEKVTMSAEGDSVTRSQGQTLQYTTTVHYDDGETTVDVTTDTIWTSDDEQVVLISSTTPPGAGRAFAIGEGQAVIRAAYSGLEVATTLTVSNDDAKPAFLSVEMKPDVVIVGKGVNDPSELTATAFPFNPDQSIETGTPFDFSVIAGDAEISPTSAATDGLSGIVKTEVTALEPGLIAVRVDAQDTFAWGTAPLAAVNDFAEIFNTLQLTGDSFEEETVLKGETYVLVVNNPSNRPFTMTHFSFGPTGQEDRYTFDFGGDGQVLPGRQTINIVVEIRENTANDGFVSRLEMKEKKTNTAFELERTLSAPTSP